MDNFIFRGQQNNRCWPNLIPPGHKFGKKYASLYSLKRYKNYFYKLKKRNTKKQNKHLGVLFLIDFFRRMVRCRSPPVHH